MRLWLNSEAALRAFAFILFVFTKHSKLFHRRVLITTDVWARGIDVQQVSLVINYDLPAYVFIVLKSGQN